MYLKSITMQGFKSFANKIELDFHDGITCIVGPNGSGKSNVADAVRWVLGEQSAKQLRGGNMQDVIFSGTETRKPLGFASVAITFDNSDHMLKYDAEEVEVSRKLFRSGESEYRLNGRNCRLRDINELFFDTGIGKEGYSIIGQGQIDKILSGKPEDRRELFDEAAGIVKFKRRKAASIKKLEGEEQNLVRVKDILSELDRQRGPLEEQSQKAERYLKLRDELKEADFALFCRESSRIESQLDESGKAYEIAKDHQNRLEAEFERTRQEYDKVEQELDTLEQKIQENRDGIAQSRLRKQNTEGRINVLNEQVRSGIHNSEVIVDRMEALDGEIARKKEDASALAAGRKELRSDLAKIEKKKSEGEDRLHSLQDEMASISLNTEKNRSETISLLNHRTSIKERMQRYDTMLEQIEIRKAEIQSALISSASQKKEINEEQSRLTKAHEDVAGEVAKNELELEKTTAENQKLRDSLERMNHDMEIGRTAWHRESSRLESLRNLAERYEGYGNSIKRIMAKRDDNPGIHGVVAELLQTEKKYETAIETALGGSMQNIVTDNESTAKQMIEYLKSGHYGRATFLPLTAVKRGKPFDNNNLLNEPGVIGLASSLVRCEKIYTGIAESLLGRTVVVDHIDHAIAIGRKYHHTARMVTIEGELLNPGGSMTGGAYRNNSNLLGRRREIEELTKDIAMLKQDMDGLQAKIDETSEKRRRTKEKEQKLQEKLQKLYLDENTAKINLESGTERIRAAEEQENHLKKELRELENQTSEIKVSRDQVNAELQDSHSEESRLTEAVKSAGEKMSALSEKEKKERDILNQILVDFANAAQKDQFLSEKIREDEAEIRRLQAEKEGLSGDRDRENTETGKKKEEIQALQDGLEKLDQDILSRKEEVEALGKKKEEMTRSHRAFFEKRDALSEERNQIDRECFRLNARIEKLTEDSDQITASLWEEYQLTPDQVQMPEAYEKTGQGELKKTAGSLRKQIRDLGDININAIDQYKELKERYDFLSGQYDDIIRATDSLKDIIRRLDVSMRKQFREKFADIQKEYDKVFQELFGGGKGTLELVEDEDVLEAGIIIGAQPPGKKLQNMMQLSGGEKALTAIALLFAIQNLKPSPFCLLDEIEAALDESNVDRYSAYLHKLTKNTQFIIITHRRGTMAAADRLYGITMQEKGVSALVSVKLIENELDK
jgi:chromosome segregation protein